MKNRENVIIALLVFLFLSSVIVSVGQKVKANRNLLKTTAISSKQGVAVIPLYGVIEVEENDFFISMGVDSIIQNLEIIEKDKNIKAVVLRINSPGGLIGSSQELYHEVMSFRQRTKKPVVVSIIDYGASGAYWVALAADYIMAHSGSIVGSMGVITQTMDLTQIKEKYGISLNTYKSAKHKDLLNPWRPATEKEKIIVNRMLKNMHRQFVDTLVERRKINRNRAEKLADGRIYSGEQALSLGLVDQLGGLKDAVRQAGKMAGIKGKPVIIRKQRPSFRHFLKQFKSEIFTASLKNNIFKAQLMEI